MNLTHQISEADLQRLDGAQTSYLRFLDPDRMMSTTEVTQMLGISRAFLHILVKRGDLVPLRFDRGIRFRRRDVLAFCEDRIRQDAGSGRAVAV